MADEDSASVDSAHSIDEALRSRHSCRRFRDRPIDASTVEELLELARWAPSNGNTQPWRVYVVGGDVKQDLSEAVVRAARSGNVSEAEYLYYPQEWFEPYQSRRRACGWGLYGALGIERGEREKAQEQNLRNFTFFDAPVGLVLTVDRRMEHGSWIDLGAFLQSFALAARARGLHTCPQAAFSNFHEVLREHLPIPDEEIVVCGIALGFRDPEAPENVWRADRAPVEEFTTWCGVEPRN